MKTLMQILKEQGFNFFDIAQNNARENGVDLRKMDYADEDSIVKEDDNKIEKEEGYKIVQPRDFGKFKLIRFGWGESGKQVPLEKYGAPLKITHMHYNHASNASERQKYPYTYWLYHAGLVGWCIEAEKLIPGIKNIDN